MLVTVTTAAVPLRNLSYVNVAPIVSVDRLWDRLATGGSPEFYSTLPPPGLGTVSMQGIDVIT